MIGETFSHFRIVGKIGEGGMGVVYRAVDLNLDRPVAIKILAAESQRDADSEGRFLREAKTASKLQHPAITTIYEFGVKEDQRYLVMEFIEGQTLRQILQKGPMPLRQTLEIGIQMADALSLAAEKGIIHRDIKSDNVMVTPRGQVKILDFGLAKMVEKTGPATDVFETQAGLVLGTVSYMSPEQTLGAALDARTDIYSTGVVLYEMLAGRLPFVGESPQTVLARVLNDPAPALTSLNGEVPPEVERLVHRCLEKDREKRLSTATELTMELKRLKQQLESGRPWSGTIVAAVAGPGSGAAATATRKTDSGAETVALPASEGANAGSGSRPAAAQATAPSGSGSQAAAAPTKEPKPPVRPQPQRVSGRAAAAVTAGRLKLAAAVGLGRKLVTLAMSLYAICCVAVFTLPLIKLANARVKLPEKPVQFLHSIVDPLAQTAAAIVPVNLTYQGLNFIVLGLAVATWFVQQMVAGRLHKIEEGLRQPKRGKSGAQGWAPGAVAPGANRNPGEAARISLLRDYAAAQRILGEVKKELTFLAIDVAGSTKMKSGEDKLAVEHAFTEYKKFLERIFRECECWKVAWTPDGVMTAFPTPEKAVTAARKILVDLDWFNTDVHQLRTNFRVRCGMNMGEVMVPDEKPLEEVSDEVIDIAGHMQKYAEVDSLWISAETYFRLADRSGFIRITQQVDGHEVYAWRKPGGR